jgi:hypothetical protein
VRTKVPGWLLAVIVAVGAAAVSGIAVYFATGSDPNTQSPTDTLTLPTSPTDTVVTSSTRLEELVEPALFRNCAVDSAPRLGASESATCEQPADQTGGFYPDNLDLYVFDSAAALAAAYDDQRQGLGIGRDFGRCSGRRWGGEGEWAHGTGAVAGRRFCTFEGNVSVLAWTHEKLGQESHKDFLGIARLGGRDHARLFSWWDFWHHRNVGKLPS